MEQKVTFHRFSNSGIRYYDSINNKIRQAVKLYESIK